MFDWPSDVERLDDIGSRETSLADNLLMRARRPTDAQISLFDAAVNNGCSDPEPPITADIACRTMALLATVCDGPPDGRVCEDGQPFGSVRSSSAPSRSSQAWPQMMPNPVQARCETRWNRRRAVRKYKTSKRR